MNLDTVWSIKLLIDEDKDFFHTHNFHAIFLTKPQSNSKFQNLYILDIYSSYYLQETRTFYLLSLISCATKTENWGGLEKMLSEQNHNSLKLSRYTTSN